MADPPTSTRPVRGTDLAEVASLFGTERSTRRCWCTAFCSSGSEFARGWVTGGNRARFEQLAVTSPTPMGVVALVGEETVGWAACGPRSRYAVAQAGRSRLLQGRDSGEDEHVWLLPCLFVSRHRRGHGLTGVLVAAAVELARSEGASAIEGWPSTAPGAGEAFLGREQTFARAGFRCVSRPLPGRALVRLDLAREPDDQATE